jgi:hypothetical protein
VKDIALRSQDGSGFVSSIIAQGTYGEVNHTSIEFVDDGVVIEAHAKNGVTERPSLGHGLGDVVHRFSFAVPDEEYAEALAFAREQVGKPYDRRAIIRFIPGLRNLVKSDREASGRWICSELGEVVLRKAGRPTVRKDIKAESVSPQDQFKSIRCDLSMTYGGPFLYQRIVKGQIVESRTDTN